MLSPTPRMVMVGEMILAVKGGVAKQSIFKTREMGQFDFSDIIV